MDHPEVRERLEGRLIERGGLAGLLDEASPESVALREHLAGCPACRREFDALRTTGVLLANAAPDDLALRPEMRARVLRAVRETGVRRRPAMVAPTSPRPWFGWRLGAALVAGTAVVVLAAGMLLGGSLVQQRDAANDQLVALSHVTTAADRLLAAPDHTQLTLRDAQGHAAGTVLFDPSSNALLVFSTSLRADAPRDSYDCYLERDGQRTRIGWMEAAGSISYWLGGLPAGATMGPGDRFLVLTDQPGATPELSGTF
ncbi:MAG: hypothetical protein ACRDGL_04760 [Candidatus Limnocylindrales bacterium]